MWKLPQNPVADIERLPVSKRTDIEFYSPEEVHALVRASGDEQDEALCLTAAMTGLRMGELLALRWSDVDFATQTMRVTASYTAGTLGTPKSGLGRAPLVDEVAQALARLGRRERWIGPDDLVVLLGLVIALRRRQFEPLKRALYLSGAVWALLFVLAFVAASTTSLYARGP